MIPVSAVYIALNALILVGLGVLVVRERWRSGVGLGMGKGDSRLARLVRCHANAAEYMPLCLLLIVALELMAAPVWLLHIFGLLLTAGRILHPFGLLRSAGASWQRAGGTALTWHVLILAPPVLIYLAVT